MNIQFERCSPILHRASALVADSYFGGRLQPMSRIPTQPFSCKRDNKTRQSPGLDYRPFRDLPDSYNLRTNEVNKRIVCLTNTQWR
jgi:hypothetical protein